MVGQTVGVHPVGILRCFAVTLLFLVGTFGVFSQDASAPRDKWMQWQAYSGDHAINKRVGLHFDGGWREMTGSHWQQWLVRPGVNFEVNENTQISLTYSFFKTHPAGLEWDLQAFPEHRLAQQVQFQKATRSLVLQHRFRAEQRFFGAVSERKGDDSVWMQHRLRYLFGARIPLAQRAAESTDCYLNVYDEVMFRAKNSGVSHFEQNRIYAGIGVNPHSRWNLESGVFYQRFRPMRGGPMANSFVLYTTVRTTLPLASLLGRRSD